MKKGFILLTSFIMISFLVVLSTINFSLLNFTNRLVYDYSVSQSLLYDLQSATDKLRYQIKNSLVIDSEYYLPNGTQIKFDYNPVLTVITATRNNNQQQIVFRGNVIIF